jgi:hypothetical protein
MILPETEFDKTDLKFLSEGFRHLRHALVLSVIYP